MLRWMIILPVSFLILFPATEGWTDIYNPKPADGDMALPMPSGASMVFRPVFIAEGDALFALRKFKVGDPSGGFKEYPTSVAIGGAFIDQRKGQRDWLYYIGKYEVTEAQYYAVMGLPSMALADLKTSQYPIRNISWFDANKFIDRYNQWLFANAIDKLPQNDGAIGYLRLPVEVEWEFAARGGAEVEPDDFDRKHPYPGNLAKYEWFAGPKSSHNKVKKIGILEPNPLKIHDMLSNVSEITHSLYQIEYYQGRCGGFVARGGHFLTAEKNIRSSLRTEEPFYIGDPKKGPLKPNFKQTMGIRLVITSLVFVNRNMARTLAAAWDDYRGGKGAGLPAAVSVSPTSTQASIQSEDAFIHFDRLNRELAGFKLSERARQELGLLKASLADIRFIRKQAEEDSAYAWAKIAAERGFFIFRELRKLPTMERLKNIAEKSGRIIMVERYKNRLAEFTQNIEQALSTYSDALRQLAKINPAAIEVGFQKYIKFLLDRNAEDQVRVLKTVKDHFAAYLKEKRADKDKWRRDFANIRT